MAAVVDLQLLLLQLRQLTVHDAERLIQLVGDPGGRGLQLGHPIGDGIRPLPCLRECGRRPLLLVQGGLPQLLSGPDHVGGVGVHDVQESHRCDDVPGIATGEKEGQRGESALNQGPS